MFLPPELVACILKMEGNYFFWKQTNQLQKIKKLNKMLTLHKSRLKKIITTYWNFESRTCLELELPISLNENTSYVIRRYISHFHKDYIFKRYKNK
jgi:hypothetical protein